MELAMSAVTGELVSRFISFLMNKYHSSSRANLEEEKVEERLQHLLMRARTLVEEADGRYITNSGMLMQLKILSQAMYQGYRVLDTFRYRTIQDSGVNEVSDQSSFSLAIPLKRSRTMACTRKDKILYLELHGALENLDIAVANMTEFVVLLAGCERMSRRPYDAYLYNDNFMFGRHTEKQKLLSFLLQHNPPGPLAVLPIIGGLAVGKKTLVAHVCNDERVSLHFSSILRLNEADILRIADHQRLKSGRTLVVVEFVSDVDDVDWTEFFSSVASMDRGSKVIILSGHKKTEKLGTVKPIFLNDLSYEEFSYLFKTLAFGSANPVEHPQLVRIGEEFVKELQFGWSSLVPANAFADVLRRNLNVQVWLSILNRYKRVIQKNLSVYGVHPNILFGQGHPVDIADFVLHPASGPLRIEPRNSSSSTMNVPRKELQKVTFLELLVDPTVRPKGEFNLFTWESRIPPYTSIVHFIPSCAQEMHETPLSGRKRGGFPI